jgi:hypothetical protein
VQTVSAGRLRQPTDSDQIGAPATGRPEAGAPRPAAACGSHRKQLMSKQNNVNPNFYKTGGREHAEGHGEAIPHDQEKKKMTELPGSKKGPKKKAVKR